MIVYQHPGLTGLEIWHGVAKKASLYQLRTDKASYFEGLRAFLIDLHQGRAQTEDPQDTAGLQAAKGFSRAIFCGGEAIHPMLREAMHHMPFAITVDKQGPYASRPGALAIMQELGWKNGVALDLGQTQLKVFTADDHALLPRDEERLPFGANALDAATGQARLRQYLKDGLMHAPQPDGVVLALPVALDAQGTARSATYPGLFGPIEPIFAPVFGDTPWVVLNDAVLAARGFHATPKQKTIVVTLGFGVGGALWRP